MLQTLLIRYVGFENPDECFRFMLNRPKYSVNTAATGESKLTITALLTFRRPMDRLSWRESWVWSSSVKLSERDDTMCAYALRFIDASVADVSDANYVLQLNLLRCKPLQTYSQALPEIGREIICHEVGHPLGGRSP